MVVVFLFVDTVAGSLPRAVVPPSPSGRQRPSSSAESRYAAFLSVRLPSPPDQSALFLSLLCAPHDVAESFLLFGLVLASPKWSDPMVLPDGLSETSRALGRGASACPAATTGALPHFPPFDVEDSALFQRAWRLLAFKTPPASPCTRWSFPSTSR